MNAGQVTSIKMVDLEERHSGESWFYYKEREG
jgi:hypothetical protein